LVVDRTATDNSSVISLEKNLVEGLASRSESADLRGGPVERGKSVREPCGAKRALEELARRTGGEKHSSPKI